MLNKDPVAAIAFVPVFSKEQRMTVTGGNSVSRPWNDCSYSFSVEYHYTV